MSRDTCLLIRGTTIDFEFLKSLSLSQWHLDHVHKRLDKTHDVVAYVGPRRISKRMPIRLTIHGQSTYPPQT